MEFFNDCLSEFSAFPALAGNTELRSKICHIAGTATAEIANLVIGDLSANTNVHGYSLVWT